MYNREITKVYNVKGVYLLDKQGHWGVCSLIFKESILSGVWCHVLEAESIYTRMQSFGHKVRLRLVLLQNISDFNVFQICKSQ